MAEQYIKGECIHPVVPPNLTWQEWAVHDCYARIGILYFFSHWMTSAARRIYQPKSAKTTCTRWFSFPPWPTFLSPNSLEVTNNNLWKGHVLAHHPQKGHNRRIARQGSDMHSTECPAENQRIRPLQRDDVSIGNTSTPNIGFQETFVSFPGSTHFGGMHIYGNLGMFPQRCVVWVGNNNDP